MTMNQEIKAEWVKRLRSGDYKQGRNHLNGDGFFCCLGVLCEIAVEQGVATKIPQATYDATNDRVLKADGTEAMYKDKDSVEGAVYVAYSNEVGVSRLDGYSDQMLPAGVMEWAGISSQFVHVDYEGKKVTLDVINDEKGEDFLVIADIIEKQL